MVIYYMIHTHKDIKKNNEYIEVMYYVYTCTHIIIRVEY